jgi:high-affinity nickel-transport protein
MTARARLVWMGTAIAALHAAGWGLLLLAAGPYPALAAVGGTAYLLGLRHGFDVDHITAIDVTTRKLSNDGQRPLAVGFFFALGHSTIVLALAVAVGLAATTVGAQLDGWGAIGGWIGVSVSGLFLLLMGALNVAVLVDLVAAQRALRRGARVDPDALRGQLGRRGAAGALLDRGGRLIRSSRSIYPVGVLFGLGFDTATEIGLLALTAGAAAGALPLWAVLALPLLFMAGMTLVDSANGVAMARAYGWANGDPLRRLRYNVTVTGISAVVALSVAAVQLTTLAADGFRLEAGFAGWVTGVDFELLGYTVVATLLTVWAVAALGARRRPAKLAAAGD